jgi:hypothetical protein
MTSRLTPRPACGEWGEKGAKMTLPKQTRKLTGDHNQCTGCGEYFNSTFAFDAHRSGAYGGKERRCLTPAEMLEKGMGQKTDGKGQKWWITNIGKSYHSAISSPLGQQNSVPEASDA